MNFAVTSRNIRHFPFRQSLLLVRPFHIIHQMVIVLMVISLNGISPSPLEILMAWLMLFLLMPFLFGLNDWMHRDEDAEMGRDRLFTSGYVSPKYVPIFLVSILVVMNAIAFSSSLVTLGWLEAMIVCGLLYGYFKHQRYTFLTYLFRTFSGMTFYLVVASYFGYWHQYLVALFVGLLDLFSHIAGDLRDYPMDLKGNVRTFPVRYGIGNTRKLILAVFAVSMAYLSLIIALPAVFWIFLSIFAAVGWVIYLLLDALGIHALQHAAFHGVKIACYSLIAGFLISRPLMVAGVMFAWAVSYLAYLWSDGRLGEIRWWEALTNPLGI